MAKLAKAQDSDLIVFAAGPEGKRDIFSMTSDGQNVKQLVTNAEDDTEPAWSPGKEKIAFASQRQGEYNIYVMNKDGSDQRAVTTNLGTSNEEPSWAPDGQQIAFISNVQGSSQVHIVNASGGQPQAFTTDKNYECSTPAWSPDGAKIAFASNREGNFQIYVMDIAGGSAHQLTKLENADNDSPAWSPDGTEIAFASNQNGDSEIYVMKADGSDLKFITSTPNTFAGAISWSTDGKSLAFMQWNKNERSIRAIALDGQSARQITTSDLQAGWPSWNAPKLVAKIDSQPQTTPSDSGNAASNEEQVGGLMAIRPANHEDLSYYRNVWFYTNYVDLYRPGTKTYNIRVENRELGFSMYWCGSTPERRDYIGNLLNIHFFVNGKQVPDSAVLIYDYIFQHDPCRRWGTLLSAWKSGSKVTLEIRYSISEDLMEGGFSYKAGDYRQILNATVR
ncbi:MAG: hypothetical protein ABI947_15450 [Chloroflexota bacterium]